MPHFYSKLNSTSVGLPPGAYANSMLWFRPPTLNNGLPTSIKVWASNSSITGGIPLRSFYAIINLGDELLKFETVFGDAE
jgi:hypothetical protein